jgi:hypothetical protein
VELIWGSDPQQQALPLDEAGRDSDSKCCQELAHPEELIVVTVLVAWRAHESGPKTWPFVSDTIPNDFVLSSKEIRAIVVS